MIIVSGIRIPLGENKEQAIELAAKKLSLTSKQIQTAVVHRVSYDARHGSVFLVCSVAFSLFREENEIALAEKNNFVRLKQPRDFAPTVGENSLETRPVIVGFGPAGMFSALLLSRHGFRPIVIEQGEDVEQRTATVETFFKQAKLNEVSNIQFGEGGAGTFSDGKLTTRINDPLCDIVLKTLCDFGAPEEILWQAKPHIGTDILKSVVKNIRNEIISLGGEVRFNTSLCDLSIVNNKIKSVKTKNDEIKTDVVVVAVGNGGRKAFELLANKGLILSAKPFSVGMRIEHLRKNVEQSVFGKLAGHPLLPSAEYALSAHVGTRSVYTFCMCPGGEVVAASSEQGGVLTNGMSFHARDGKNSNSAVCVSLSKQDFGDDPFKAIEYQKNLEQKAFEFSSKNGHGYCAVGTDVKNLFDNKMGLNITSVTPTFPLGVTACNLNSLFGSEITKTLGDGIRAFSKKLRCFSDTEAVLTGPETRTSSPVRIERGDEMTATGFSGIYPIGEGAGYAGGIMSSAIDGVKAAEKIIERYKPMYT